MAINVEKAENQPTHDLSFNDADRLLKYSFFLSQGNPDLQSCLFLYLSHKHPDWRISPSIIEPLAESVFRMALGLSEKGQHTSLFSKQDTGPLLQSEDVLKDEAYEEANQMANVLSGDELPYVWSPKKLLFEITRSMIDQDEQFLQEVRPRKGTTVNGRLLTPLQDPYLSHFCFFILGKNSLGVPDYNQMFDDIRNLFASDSSKLDELDKGERRIARLIDKYNLHHPDDQVSLGVLTN